MTPPGMWLRALAARLCDAKAMTHLIDPLVADLQHEHADAQRDGAIWHSRRIRFAGGLALIKVLFLYRGVRTMEILRRITANDSVGARAVRYSTLAMAAATALLMLPLLASPSPIDPQLVLYAVPQALPLAIPFGLIVGILSAFGGRAVSRRAAGQVLLLAAVCSALMFVTIGWLVPSANYAYRVHVAEQVGTHVAFEKPILGAPLWKGPNELTLPEFRRMYLSVTTTDVETGLPRAGWYSPRNLWFMYHLRWALPCASLVFALVALSVTRHRRAVRITALLAATAVYFYMFALAEPGPARWWSSAAQEFPPGVLAWLPNILVAGAALAWMAAGRLRPEPAGQ
jgi:hypothetical protein